MTSATQTIALPQVSHSEISDDIVIGKDILDLLTGSMYVEPLSIYREYVQNAADAIEEARDQKLYSGDTQPKVEIRFDIAERSVLIRDNGAGVSASEFVKRLTAVGASKKRGSTLRGFRGVGRLSGLGYCQELVFRSRAAGDRRVSEIVWDGRKLKDLLRNAGDTTDLVQAIKSIARTRQIPGLDAPLHFFEVELRKLARSRNDLLLNEEDVVSYLAQVAPVPFAPEFRFGEMIAEHLARFSRYQPIDLYVGDSQVFRPHRNKFPITDKIQDGVAGITFLEIPGLDNSVDAAGWILKHSFLGAIPKRAHVEGIRARIGDIQIGNADIFSHLFPEARFNSWCIGEVHILSKRIVPNGRRDDFEANAHLQNLHGYLANEAKLLVKTCRDKSILRNRLKKAAVLVESADQSIAIAEGNRFPALRHYFSDYSSRLLKQLEDFRQQDGLSTGERQLIQERCDRLAGRLELLGKRRGTRRHPLASLAPAKRNAFESAIAVVLASTLPIAIRAGLTEQIVRAARKRP